MTSNLILSLLPYLKSEKPKGFLKMTLLLGYHFAWNVSYKVESRKEKYKVKSIKYKV